MSPGNPHTRLQAGQPRRRPLALSLDPPDDNDATTIRSRPRHLPIQQPLPPISRRTHSSLNAQQNIATRTIGTSSTAAFPMPPPEPHSSTWPPPAGGATKPSLTGPPASGATPGAAGPKPKGPISDRDKKSNFRSARVNDGLARSERETEGQLTERDLVLNCSLASFRFLFGVYTISRDALVYLDLVKVSLSLDAACERGKQKDRRRRQRPSLCTRSRSHCLPCSFAFVLPSAWLSFPRKRLTPRIGCIL